ncbi:MAG: bifunctional demethylmenaquinone methyltransferase/2-methoxy-6-polyprenyl-1,4-benzoquinol methylase UbiE [Flavobacteriales bacterium]|nr:bifunctional demethylmenaquinone methyltransferase/2-methoxy-6-polyprenyl-1,4-benzoquinol methylase UbiE [Flavobacteriales bacterium]|tara:strand:+ start:36495 stop:37214 length:720 start_codon:yes stop_codon:yes gene_type:complete
MNKITPYNNSKTKKEQVKSMFNNIAKNYDFLNNTLSVGMHNIWRKQAIQKLNNNPKEILDVATGTGDFAVTAANFTNANITAIDISKNMLNVGIKKSYNKKLENRISFKEADAENLPFTNNKFDAITVGFGVRNFENLNKGLDEIYRVLSKDGILVILEPSIPITFPVKHFYKLYFNYILPIIGYIISGDKNAYKYLPESVKKFPSGKKFINHLIKSGFKNCKHLYLTFGIVSMYIAIK